MSTETFGTDEFRAALPNPELWRQFTDKGEYVYALETNAISRIIVRSSISPSTGMADGTGEDSIRIWREFRGLRGWNAVQKQPLTQRVSGWQKRMNDKLAELMSLPLPDESKTFCRGCNKMAFIGVVKKEGANKGRPFASCRKHNFFNWIDEMPQPSKSPLSSMLSDAMSQMSAAGTTSQKPAPTSDYKPVKLDEYQSDWVDAPFEDGTPYSVNAGAGSGKTTAMVQKIIKALESGYDTSDIIVVTKLSNAAKNMLEKLQIEAAVRGVDISGMERQVCTFHAFCFRRAKELGLVRPTAEVIYDSKLKRYIEDACEKVFPSGDDMPAADEIMMLIKRCEFEGVELAYWKSLVAQLCGSIEDEYTIDRVMTVIGSVIGKMREANQITFSQMVWGYHKTIKADESILRNEQGKLVFVDEFQDTDRQALWILLSLAMKDGHTFDNPGPGNFQGIGDPDQTIYRFTGAAPEIMVTEIKQIFPNLVRKNMPRNYRSEKQIVEHAGWMIKRNYAQCGGPDPAELYKKPVWVHDNGINISVDDYETPMEEAEALAETIKGMWDGSGHPLVMARTRAQLAYPEMTLTKAGIPCLNLVGYTFWAMRHVKLAWSILAVALSDDLQESDLAFAYTVNSPPTKGFKVDGQRKFTRRLGRDFVNDVRSMRSEMAEISGEKKSLYEILKVMAETGQFYGKRESAVNDYIDMIEDVREREHEAFGMGVEYVIELMIDYLKHKDGVGANGDDDNRKDDDLTAIADIYYRLEGIDGLIEYAREAIELAERAKDILQWDGHVILSTVHRMKGLEDDICFVIGASEGEIIRKGEAQFYGIFPHTFSVIGTPPTPVLGIMSIQGSVEDERRLFYVAITRARKHLFISSIEEYNSANLHRSRFIDEMFTNPDS